LKVYGAGQLHGAGTRNELTCNIASVMLLTFPKNRKL
jgi:hypothetical protein